MKVEARWELRGTEGKITAYKSHSILMVNDMECRVHVGECIVTLISMFVTTLLPTPRILVSIQVVY